MLPPELQQEMSMMMSPPIIAGAVTWLVSQVFILIVMIGRKPKNRKVDEAVRRGHVIKAHIKGRVDRLNRPEDGGKGRRMFSCDYEYAVNGERMIYRYIGYTMPPDPLTLYYLNDPGRAFPGDNINNYGRDMAGAARYALVFIIPVLLGAAAMFALGGVPI